MKNMKQKIKFTDIAGMLDRDQMREITGGCGEVVSGSASWDYSGGGGGSSAGSSWSSITGMGFGGQLSYGGVSASSSGVSSSGTANSSTTSNPGGAWTNTSVGVTTSDPTTIKRFMSYLDWENVILNNNPTSSQMISFLNEDRLTSGRGTLTDGTTLANEATMYMLGNTLQWTSDPYEAFHTIETFSRISQNIGDSMITGGFALSATGVGAVIGAPMIEFGSAISGIGTVGELYSDLNSNEPFDYTKWIVKAGLEAVPNIYGDLFGVKGGVMGFDQALIEMYTTASDHWFDFMRERNNP